MIIHHHNHNLAVFTHIILYYIWIYSWQWYPDSFCVSVVSAREKKKKHNIQRLKYSICNGGMIMMMMMMVAVGGRQEQYKFVNSLTW